MRFHYIEVLYTGTVDVEVQYNIKVQLYVEQKYCDLSETDNIALLLLVSVLINFRKCIHVNGF